MAPNRSLGDAVSLRLDSKMLTYAEKDGALGLDVVYAVKGKTRRENVGAWSGDAVGIVGLVEVRSQLHGTRQEKHEASC